MARRDDVELTRATNLRENLARIFDSWAVQTRVAADAGISNVHLNRLLHGKEANPTINVIEALSIALEIPLETLISRDPSDLDLKISKKKALRRA